MSHFSFRYPHFRYHHLPNVFNVVYKILGFSHFSRLASTFSIQQLSTRHPVPSPAKGSHISSVMPSLNLIPSFPPYPGPYPVGTREYEIPVSEVATADVPPPPKEGLSTLKFRAFYPTTNGTREHESRGKVRFWTHGARPVYWLPEPQTKWLNAYAAFMGMNGFVAKLFA